MPRSPNPRVAVAGGHVSIVMLIFAAFVVMIFVTASVGISSMLGSMIPVWAIMLVIALLGVGLMFGAALMVTKSRIH